MAGEKVNVEDLLRVLIEKYGDKFLESLKEPNGNIKPYIQVLVNGKNVIFLEGFCTELRDRDVVAFISHAAGG